MIKIRDEKWNYFKEHYKDYGFHLEAEKSYYYKKLDDGSELFIWKFKGYDYKPQYLYIESRYCQTIMYDFKTIYELHDLIQID